MTSILFPDKEILYNGYSKTEFLKLLKEKLENRNNKVEKAYIFGSVANNTERANSDIDLFIITKTNLPFLHRVDEFQDIRDFHPGIEMLIYTPKEWAKLVEQNSPGFWSSALKNLLEVV